MRVCVHTDKLYLTDNLLQPEAIQLHSDTNGVVIYRDFQFKTFTLELNDYCCIDYYDYVH